VTETAMTAFSLDPQLTADCEWLADLALCKVLLLKDANYPWLVLVPQVANCKEIIDLSDTQQEQLWRESATVSRVLQQLFNPDKLNVAALGNMVPQLHIHHIARFKNDISWPKPVWGQHPAKSYDADLLAERSAKIVQLLNF
jgi:diadenosine tetraphosphate (Ap4A) HIT family hydrolase